MYKSQLQKIDPYVWFCGPGSHKLKQYPQNNYTDWDIIYSSV